MLTDARPAVVISAAASPVERGAISDWLAEADVGDLELVPARAEALAERLRAGGDPTLVPIGVAWLPRDRGGDRRVSALDLLGLSHPRRPRRRVQARIRRRDPGRCRVVVGEPARVEELREAYAAESDGGGDAEAFAAYVERRAGLALDRAERAIVGHRYKAPRFVAEALAEDPSFRSAVGELAARLGEDEDELLERAGEHLRGLATVQSPLAVDLFTEAVRPTWAKAWTVRADVEGAERLRRLNREHALVFLPSHRSYADSWVLDAVLAEHDFPRTHIVGGENMGFWPLGPVLRRTGAVLIRRKFGDDELYKLAVREFLGYMLGKRFNLEWYIEGGRSRTGKLRPPRMGLLRFAADAVESGRAGDVHLVPVSITYDQLAEVRGLAAQELGAKKQPEGARWFVRWIRAQQQHLGEAQVRFGEPLSLGQALAEGDADRELAISKVAFEISDRINRATPITATATVTIALLGVGGRAVTVGELQPFLDPLLDYVERRGLPAAGTGALRRAAGIRTTLAELERAGVVARFDGGLEPVFSIDAGCHQVAAYYRNSAVHWLLNRAIVELVVVEAATDEQGGDAERVLEGALALRDMLKFEFFFPPKRMFRDELIAEVALLEPRWREAIGSADEARALLVGSGFLIAPRVLRPFLEAYAVATARLADRDPRDPVDREAFAAECAGIAHQYLLQGQLRSPESESLETFANALKLAANRNLLDPGHQEVARGRRDLAAEVAAVHRRLDDVAALDPSLAGAS